MYQILNPSGFVDKSPYQFARMDWLKQRVDENYQKLVELRKQYSGRLDSQHLLMKILQNLNVEFDGDLDGYMSRCENAARRLCGVLGISSSFSKGKLFEEGVFYPGCREIIIYSRNSKYSGMDLWRDWRSVAPIEVLNHPVTSTQVIELGVMNEAKLSNPGLCVISIDIPLMAAQWKLWQAGNPKGELEEFITTVPLVSMIKSHLNVAMFNMVGVGKVFEECSVKSNLPFAQNDSDLAAKALAEDVWQKLISRALEPNQMLASVPVFYGDNYLEAVRLASTTPTFQVMWALISHKVDRAAFVLEICKAVGYDRALAEITIIKRTLITDSQDKTLSNGLSSETSGIVKSRLADMVVSRLPE